MRATAAALALFVLVSGAAPAAARPLDDVRQSGAIRIAVYRDFPPFSEVDGGNFTGVDVDIGRAIAERLGLRVDFMALTAGETVDDDLRNAVWKGHYLGGGVADVMLHVPVDRRFALRNKQVALFGAYERMQLVEASERTADGAVELAGIDGERIGVEIASLGDFYLVSAFNGRLRGNVVHYPSAVAAAQALRDGDVAVALASQVEMEAGLGSRRETFALTPVNIPGASWTIGAAVDERSRDLGYAVGDILAEMIENGEMERIFRARALSYLPPDSE